VKKGFRRALLPRGAGATERVPYGMRRYQASNLGLSIVLLLLPSLGFATDGKKPGTTAGLATAGPTEQLGAAGAWTAYTYREKSSKVCYLAGAPQTREPAGAKRKHPVAMVTHRPGENVANVVSFVEGYPLKPGSDVSLEIGGAKFDLFTKADTAWARTSDLDKAIVEALAKGKQAVVKGEPEKGPATTDVYSLAGFGEALALIDKSCEIKR
jgi:hypothetical protein